MWDVTKLVYVFSMEKKSPLNLYYINLTTSLFTGAICLDSNAALVPKNRLKTVAILNVLDLPFHP